MLQNIEHKERRSILNREIDNKKELKEELGQLIKFNREEKGESQRKLAKAIDLANSNLKYIEDGINAPSPKVYKNIILLLKPSDSDRSRMDFLYSQIRGTPPPDICEFMLANNEIFDSIRKNKCRLTRTQTEKLNILLEAFAKENIDNMEEINYG